MSGVTNTISNARSKVFGIDDQSQDAQNMAMAQQNAAKAVTTEARDVDARMRLAAQSPSQLLALEKSLGAAQKETEFNLRQLDAVDPAIMEASKQVLGILQGKQVDSNNPLMAQRQQQRTQMLNSLRAQYGPGAENTSIGQRMLSQFDMQSNTMFQQNQQNTLGNLFGMATTQPGVRGITDLNNVSQGYGGYQERQLQATGAGGQNVLSALSGEVGSAGAQFTGSYLRDSAKRQFFENMENDGRQIGRSWATFGMSNKGGGGGGTNSTGGTSGGMGTSWGGGSDGMSGDRGNGIGARGMAGGY